MVYLRPTNSLSGQQLVILGAYDVMEPTSKMSISHYNFHHLGTSVGLLGNRIGWYWHWYDESLGRCCCVKLDPHLPVAFHNREAKCETRVCCICPLLKTFKSQLELYLGWVMLRCTTFLFPQMSPLCPITQSSRGSSLCEGILASHLLYVRSQPFDHSFNLTVLICRGLSVLFIWGQTYGGYFVFVNVLNWICNYTSETQHQLDSMQFNHITASLEM